MRNIRLVIEYDGSRYDGWQKQKRKGSNTIQEKIEEVLEKMEGKPVELIGGARTEAGGHAYEQIANFKTDSKKKMYEIKHYLNRYLPMDIAVLEVDEVPERFHSAFGARAFIYEYKITMGDVPSVFQRKYNYYCFQQLDAEKMREASKYFLGKHDFKAFSDNKRMKKSTERVIHEIDIYADMEEMSITIQADDFWPRMARIMVGTLIEVGRGEIPPEKVKDIIESKDREQAGETAEAKGLFLQEIIYE
ncbi:MAG: tRNA pseudouridine(38-40) synthase TruA [Lachnospiraceae bacterium]|nr:tRNA pseudouridine(38-40) synthase TruA [Lachnospiraceae bacterium]